MFRFRRKPAPLSVPALNPLSQPNAIYDSGFAAYGVAYQPEGMGVAIPVLVMARYGGLKAVSVCACISTSVALASLGVGHDS